MQCPSLGYHKVAHTDQVHLNLALLALEPPGAHQIAGHPSTEDHQTWESSSSWGDAHPHGILLEKAGYGARGPSLADGRLDAVHMVHTGACLLRHMVAHVVAVHGLEIGEGAWQGDHPNEVVADCPCSVACSVACSGACSVACSGAFDRGVHYEGEDPDETPGLVDMVHEDLLLDNSSLPELFVLAFLPLLSDHGVYLPQHQAPLWGYFHFLDSTSNLKSSFSKAPNGKGCWGAHPLTQVLESSSGWHDL